AGEASVDRGGRTAGAPPAVDQQQWSANAVEVEDRRVLDVSLRVLPWWTAQTRPALIIFTIEGDQGAAVLVHQTVATHPIGRTRPGDGGAEAYRLGDQRQGRVAAETVAHHAEPIRVGDADVHHLVDSGHHRLEEISRRGSRPDGRIDRQDSDGPRCQELAIIDAHAGEAEPVHVVGERPAAVDLDDQ